jgi:hypothetical protein
MLSDSQDEHEGYCLVWMDVDPRQLAAHVLGVLRHPECSTQAKRMG